MSSFDGLNLSLGSLPRISHAKSRSIRAENITGEKGQGGRAVVGTRLLSESMRKGWTIGTEKAHGLALAGLTAQENSVWVGRCHHRSWLVLGELLT